ncbi:hypothetical protein R1sor_017738 [Riccia sorocarpa]|uniref:Uncharacterized protein n=1 Tax=Riccia sorocarpa TaxID=122646 RepID=A0ABD3IBQ2_9MARC
MRLAIIRQQRECGIPSSAWTQLETPQLHAVCLTPSSATAFLWFSVIKLSCPSRLILIIPVLLCFIRWRNVYNQIHRKVPDVKLKIHRKERLKIADWWNW